jgi:hypothetical protein
LDFLILEGERGGLTALAPFSLNQQTNIGDMKNEKQKVLEFFNEKSAQGVPYPLNLHDDILTASVVKKLKEKAKKGGYTLSDEAQTVAKGRLPEELFTPYEDLDKGGKLETIMKNDYTLFAAIYFNKFDKFPKQGVDGIDWDIYKIYQDALREHTTNELEKMSWDELVQAGLTNAYRNADKQGYQQKFFDKYKTWPSLTISGRE